MPGTVNDVFCVEEACALASPFRFCFSADHAVPLKRVKGEAASQVSFFVISRICLFFIGKQLLFPGKEQGDKNKAKFRHKLSLLPLTDEQKYPHQCLRFLLS